MQRRAVPLLEASSLADLDGHTAEVGGDSINAGVDGLGDGREAADDTGDVVLVLGGETLDKGDVLRPDAEEGDEGWGAVLV